MSACKARRYGSMLTYSGQFVLLGCIVNAYGILRFVALRKHEITTIASKCVTWMNELTEGESCDRQLRRGIRYLDQDVVGIGCMWRRH